MSGSGEVRCSVSLAGSRAVFSVCCGCRCHQLPINPSLVGGYFLSLIVSAFPLQDSSFNGALVSVLGGGSQELGRARSTLKLGDALPPVANFDYAAIVVLVS